MRRHFSLRLLVLAAFSAIVTACSDPAGPAGVDVSNRTDSGSATSEAGEDGDRAINNILVRVAGTLDLSIRRAN